MKTDQNHRLLRCRYCGRGKHEDDAKFCTACGKPLVNACPRCLSECDSDARYCEICGRETLFFREGFLPPLGAKGPETVEYHAPPVPPKGFYTTPDSHGSYVFLHGFRGTKDRDKPWNCPLCGTKNSRGEITCRYCGLPFMNGCAACENDAKKSDSFCRYCGSMTAYFRGAVSDPEERKLARKYSKEEIAYWRQHGIRYLYARKIEDYEEEIRLYGEIESEP